MLAYTNKTSTEADYSNEHTTAIVSFTFRVIASHCDARSIGLPSQPKGSDRYQTFWRQRHVCVCDLYANNLPEVVD